MNKSPLSLTSSTPTTLQPLLKKTMPGKRSKINKKTRCCRLLMVAALVIPLASILASLFSCSSEQFEIPAEEVPATGLPFLYLHTPNDAEITRALMENVSLQMTDNSDNSDFSDMVMVKGHGNTSWVDPKKPYSIFFPNENNIPGLPPGTNRLLLANYKDLTLMRNELAFFLAREIGGRTDAPRASFVDLMLNGKYAGIYLLCESAEDICLREGDSIVVEVDGKARYHDTTFRTSRLNHPVSIHRPDVEFDNVAYNDISRYIQQAEDALFSEDFTNPLSGYGNYFDMDSFVEWYLVNEMAKNCDAVFYTSCFMHFSPGGKLKMGPVWDFDIAFGGYPYSKDWLINNPKNFYIKFSEWYGRLFDDPAFVAKVKERFAVYYAHRQDIIDHIDATCRLLADKVPLDNHIWGCLCSKTASEERVKNTYAKEVEELKNWLLKRMDWLHENLEKL